MTESMGPSYDAVGKLGEARQELEKGFNESDRDAAKVIFNAMCAANLQYLDKANTVHRLVWASLLYSQTVLRQHMSAQATMQGLRSAH
jgi:hypothetical protein